MHQRIHTLDPLQLFDVVGYRRGEPMNIEVSGPVTLDDPGLMREAALAGTGLAYLADWYVRDDLAAGRLVRVLQDGMPSYRGLALYYPPGRQLPAGLRAFVDLIHELGQR